ncbi:3-phosphoshikimate 1-carboxyvinyltransferase [Xylanibacter oryzae]|uniref:3-phosphoshikimate 1-carboxyvinyltransferase n=1 Tax=Xylanibacter oryzae TaxID=185293 RepID=UPI00055CDE04|nr:3-phosphoshikimate 1-carboxyvinyltransferase [Xylanibacter oryzae]
MQYIINAPKSINTTVKLPASKSISNRAMIIYALSGGKTLPENLSDCDDTNVIVNAIQNMPDVIDIKAAGTAMRFLSAYLSVTEDTHTITGTERMKHRPIGVLVDALRFLGADITYLNEEGFPPLKITGRKHEGGYLEIPGSVSSQYISALLMIGPVLCKGLTLKLTGEIISRPYIDLTLWMMKEFGAEADWSDIDTITVKPKPYKSREYSIESDWSAASYWYETLALSDNYEDEIKFAGLMDGSMQGDSIARYLFSLMGVKTIFDSTKQGIPTTVTLKKLERHVPRLDYDFINSPDLAQTFVVSCALMDIPFKFTGLRTLKIKETDRIEALKTEMKKLGYIIKDENGDSLVWDGERCEPATDIAIDTYEDHRMALSFAPAAFKLPGIKINDPNVVTKSYPNFWNDMRNVGFIIDKK